MPEQGWRDQAKIELRRIIDDLYSAWPGEGQTKKALAASLEEAARRSMALKARLEE